jgi:hypothetical protein
MPNVKTTHPDTPATTPGRDHAHGDVDPTVLTFGTFAAGQSVAGRFVASAEARQGSFASGQAAEHAAPDVL